MMSAHAVKTFFEKTAIAYDARFGGRGLATTWARLTRPSVFERQRVAVGLVRRLGAPRVLDLGCGGGLGVIAMAEAGATSVTGVDFSANMLEIARRRVGERGLSNIELVEDDVLTWPGTPHGWDLVVALGVVEYYPDASVLLARMAQLAGEWAFFSVRAWSPLRGAVRARQYARAGCPIYFLERLEIDVACAKAGFSSWSVTGPSAGSYLVLARH